MIDLTSYALGGVTVILLTVVMLYLTRPKDKVPPEAKDGSYTRMLPVCDCGRPSKEKNGWCGECHKPWFDSNIGDYSMRGGVREFKDSQGNTYWELPMQGLKDPAWKPPNDTSRSDQDSKEE
jgi:hypothetical protein